MPADRHPTADELADLALGVLKHRQAAAIKAHVARCAQCTQLSSELRGLPGLLARTQFPPMPERALQRIDLALAVEACRRAAVASCRSATGCPEGVLDSAARLGPYGHLCWAYRGKPEWADRAAEFAADGIAAGQCIKLVGDASTAGLRSELAELISSMPSGRAAGAGPAEVHELADFYEYGRDGIIDPHASIEAHRAAIDSALAAGYTGVRMVIDSTASARTAAQRDATARMEYLVNLKVKALPAGGMCAFDVEELGPDAVAELACMHPFTSRGAAPFRLYAADDADFGLAGTIDGVTAEGLFRTALGRTDPPAGNELIVDARRAEYLCDRALEELDAHAAQMGRTAVVRTRTSTSPSPATLSALTSVTIDTGDGE